MRLGRVAMCAPTRPGGPALSARGASRRHHGRLEQTDGQKPSRPRAVIPAFGLGSVDPELRVAVVALDSSCPELRTIEVRPSHLGAANWRPLPASCQTERGRRARLARERGGRSDLTTRPEATRRQNGWQS